MLHGFCGVFYRIRDIPVIIKFRGFTFQISACIPSIRIEGFTGFSESFPRKGLHISCIRKDHSHASPVKFFNHKSSQHLTLLSLKYWQCWKWNHTNSRRHINAYSVVVA